MLRKGNKQTNEGSHHTKAARLRLFKLQRTSDRLLELIRLLGGTYTAAKKLGALSDKLSSIQSRGNDAVNADWQSWESKYLRRRLELSLCLPL